MDRWNPGTLGRVVALLILGTVVAFTLEAFFLWLSTHPPVVDVLFAVLAGAGVLVSTGRVVWAAVRRSASREHLVDVAIGTSLTYALLLAFGPAWLALPSLVAGAAVISFAGLKRWIFPLAVLATTTGIAFLMQLPAFAVAEVMLRSVVTIVVLAGMGLLVTYASEVHANRDELARMAVVEERLRFARDLHDVLGRGLSVVRLKAELGVRLLDTDKDAARDQLVQIAELAGGSVTELRRVIAGYRQAGLAEELRGTSSILSLAGVRVVADPVPEGLPAPVAEAIGATIREGGTNILRHSAAENCRVEFVRERGALTVRIRNDRPHAGGVRAGHGLTGLAERLAAVRGTLEHAEAGGDFVLTARVPLDLPRKSS
ncbi:sensor histidine kinase [Amycolatopsis sp. NPDC051903]|uniref:sensor histidine kinase n=1 Tax=Amycolatopsis sp. NPDC051903 TaxID=3363936 RepID=UPI0037AB0604